MRAAVLRGGEMLVRDDVPEPEPALGQVLVQVKACGICGSDLHFTRHGQTMLDLGEEMEGVPDMGDAPLDTVRTRPVERKRRATYVAPQPGLFDPAED